MTVKTETPAPADERIADPVADNVNPEIVADPAPQPAPAEASDDGDDAPPPPNPRDEAMKRIADRLKKKREEEKGPAFTGDFSDPSQTAGNHGRPPPEIDLTPEFVRPKAPPQAGPSDSQAQPAKQFRLLVDGEEVSANLAEVARLADMTAEEVAADPARATRYAQKEIAASRRLDRAKDILRGANERPAPEQNRRAPGSPPHQEDQRAQNADNYVPEPGDDPDQDDVAKLVEDIQFGADPKDTAQRLRQIITRSTSETAERSVLTEKMSDDFSRTMQAFEQFKTSNQDILKDPNAEAVMRRMIGDVYREDMRSIGVPEDRIPLNENAAADWHRYYRVKGHKVSSPEKLMDTVKTRYTTWRGTSAATNQTQQQAPRPGAPAVNVDRTDRRQALTPQPSRGTAPPPAAQESQRPRTREERLKEMRRARGQAVA